MNHRYRMTTVDTPQTSAVPYSVDPDSGSEVLSLPNAASSTLQFNRNGRTCFVPTFRASVASDQKEGTYLDVLTFTVVTKSSTRTKRPRAADVDLHCVVAPCRYRRAGGRTAPGPPAVTRRDPKPVRRGWYVGQTGSPPSPDVVRSGGLPIDGRSTAEAGMIHLRIIRLPRSSSISSRSACGRNRRGASTDRAGRRCCRSACPR